MKRFKISFIAAFIFAVASAFTSNAVEQFGIYRVTGTGACETGVIDQEQECSTLATDNQCTINGLPAYEPNSSVCTGTVGLLKYDN